MAITGSLSVRLDATPGLKEAPVVRDPSVNALNHFVTRYGQVKYELTLAPVAQSVSPLETLAFAPFAAVVRETGPRTAHQAKLLANHDALWTALRQPQTTIDRAAGRLKQWAGQSLSAGLSGALGSLHAYAQAAQGVLDGQWSGDAIKEAWVNTLDRTGAGARALARGDLEAWGTAAAVTAALTTMLLSPRKAAALDRWRGADKASERLSPSPQATVFAPGWPGAKTPHRLYPMTDEAKEGVWPQLLDDALTRPRAASAIRPAPPRLLTDKRAAHFSDTLRHEGWGVIDTRPLFPADFGASVLKDLQRNRVQPGHYYLVAGVGEQQAGERITLLYGRPFVQLSPEATGRVARWVESVRDQVGAHFPQDRLEPEHLAVLWDWRAAAMFRGKLGGVHSDRAAFFNAAVNLHQGQSVWLYPGQRLTPTQERHFRNGDRTFFDNTRFSNLLIAPNGATSVWSGTDRAHMALPTLHSSPLEPPQDRIGFIVGLRPSRNQTLLYHLTD